MKTTTLQFTFAKSTPGTHVFTEAPAGGQPPVIGSLYVQKFLIKEPGDLTLTLADKGAADLPAGIAVPFTLEKETKNTVRFAEDEVEGKPPLIKSLYVQKWAAGKTAALVLVIHN